MKFHVPVYWVLNSAQKLKLLKFLLSGGTIPDMSERELARMVKIPNASVNRAMADFESINLVFYKRTGNSHVWSVKKDSYAYAALKKVMDAVREAGTPYGSLIKTLKEGLKGTPALSVILFGSVSKNEEKESSDIDLFVLVKSEKDKKDIEKTLDKLMLKYIRLYGNTLMPYVLTEREHADKSRAKLLAEIKKGVKII